MTNGLDRSALRATIGDLAETGLTAARNAISAAAIRCGLRLEPLPSRTLFFDTVDVGLWQDAVTVRVVESLARVEIPGEESPGPKRDIEIPGEEFPGLRRDIEIKVAARIFGRDEPINVDPMDYEAFRYRLIAVLDEANQAARIDAEAPLQLSEAA